MIITLLKTIFLIMGSCLRQELIIPTPKSTMKSVPCISTSSPQFQIIFIFSGKHIYRRWNLSQNSTALHSAGQVELLSATKSIRLNLQITTSPKQRMFSALNHGLGGFSLSLDHRQGLAQYAVETAWNITVYSISPSNNQLNLYIEFTVLHKHVYLQDNVIQDSEDPEPTTSPATEASIESLESKIFDSLSDNSASCYICLEDFELGCEVVFMPCAHMFHGNCIRTWLRTGHYCPVCRFQMPIAHDDTR